MDRDSLDELRKELQSVEDSIFASENQRDVRRQSERSANTDAASSRRSLDEQRSAKDAAQQEMRGATRQKQVLQEEQKTYSPTTVIRKTRDNYVARLVDGDERRDSLQADIKSVSSQINKVKEKHSDAQKRLTVVRLISMLDDLQSALNAKVNSPDSEDEEARAQELLKTIQELSRERERSLMQLSKKEAEMTNSVELKRKRIAELRLESDRNMNSIRDGNDAEVYGVMDRILKERRTLVADISRLEQTNEQLARIIQDTKYSANGSTTDRKAALGADDTMGTSKDPEEEKNRLRHRIMAANAEKRQYLMKTEELQQRADEDAEAYNAKMTRMLQEILVYEEENAKVKKNNVTLKSLCDSIASSMQ